MSVVTRYSHDDWLAEATRRFGADALEWRFRCPACGHEQAIRECKEAGMPVDAVAFSCVGRWIEGSKDAFERTGKGPCTYAGGGLFRLNPITVVLPDGKERTVFAFAGSES